MALPPGQRGPRAAICARRPPGQRRTARPASDDARGDEQRALWKPLRRACERRSIRPTIKMRLCAATATMDAHAAHSRAPLDRSRHASASTDERREEEEAWPSRFGGKARLRALAYVVSCPNPCRLLGVRRRPALEAFSCCDIATTGMDRGTAATVARVHITMCVSESGRAPHCDDLR
jgi:hypothetical protein